MADFTGVMGSGGGLIGTAFDPTSGTFDPTVPQVDSGTVAAQLITPQGPGQTPSQSILPTIGGGVGSLVGDAFGGPLGALIGGIGGTFAGQQLATMPQQPNPLAPLMGGIGLGAPAAAMGFGRPRAQHPNRSTYVTRRGGLQLVPKGSKMVTNRRRNAGNARAVRRALSRLAMFDHLANKVGTAMARVARRHHHSPRRSYSGAMGSHKPGCRCFACRRR